MFQEVFVETGLEEVSVLRQQRDDRYSELVAAGLECDRENLYTVDGRRVFVVRAKPVEAGSAELRQGGSPTPRPRQRNAIDPSAVRQRSLPVYERR